LLLLGCRPAGATRHYPRQSISGVRSHQILEISDRLDEAWEPLIAIAELAGGDWPKAARAAAVALAGTGEDAGAEDLRGAVESDG
jgi:hypothetical protein